MPLVRLTYPRGALGPEQKREIARRLTDVVLDAEVDAVTDVGRMVTVVHFNEVDANDWSVAGRLRCDDPDPPNHFIADVIVLEGLLEGDRKSAVHKRVTDVFQNVLGNGDAMLPLRVWVLVHELREGAWGAGGQTVSAIDVASLISSDLQPARRAEIVASIERRKRA